MEAKEFAKKYLTKVKWPRSKKATWDVEGILKNISNREFKFDLSPMKPIEGERQGKYGSLKTEAEKIVCDLGDHLMVIDTEELHLYLIANKTRKVYLNDLSERLEWTIILQK
jgi:hypothetical protein